MLRMWMNRYLHSPANRVSRQGSYFLFAADRNNFRLTFLGPSQVVGHRTMTPASVVRDMPDLGFSLRPNFVQVRFTSKPCNQPTVFSCARIRSISPLATTTTSVAPRKARALLSYLKCDQFVRASQTESSIVNATKVAGHGNSPIANPTQM